MKMMAKTPEYRIQIDSLSAEETRKLGEIIGKGISTGLFVAMTGELGSGKTVFVQGLAAGLDVPGDAYVTSPTYTLINEYPARIRLVHCDLYRLDPDSDFEDIGIRELFTGSEVVAVEWAERLGNDLPSDRLEARFEIVNDDVRRIYLTAYGQLPTDLLTKTIQPAVPAESNRGKRKKHRG